VLASNVPPRLTLSSHPFSVRAIARWIQFSEKATQRVYGRVTFQLVGSRQQSIR